MAPSLRHIGDQSPLSKRLLVGSNGCSLGGAWHTSAPSRSSLILASALRGRRHYPPCGGWGNRGRERCRAQGRVWDPNTALRLHGHSSLRLAVRGTPSGPGAVSGPRLPQLPDERGQAHHGTFPTGTLQSSRLEATADRAGPCEGSAQPGWAPRNASARVWTVSRRCVWGGRRGARGGLAPARGPDQGCAGLISAALPPGALLPQETGFWFIFHHVPTGPSVGTYSPGYSEHIPLGRFHNNRAHSNYRVSPSRPRAPGLPPVPLLRPAHRQGRTAAGLRPGTSRLPDAGLEGNKAAFLATMSRGHSCHTTRPPVRAGKRGGMRLPAG